MITTDVVIRAIGLDDYGGLASFLENNNLPEIVAHFHPFPLTDETAKGIASSPHRDRYYVALVGNRIVGFSMLRGWDEGFSVPSFGILIDHEHYGFGFGRRMTEQMISEAKRLECQSLRLTVNESNTRAVGLYRSLGFREISREPVVVESQVDRKLTMVMNLDQ